MPRGHCGRWPRLAPGWTCQLLAIDMFESGPYGRDGNVLSPGANQGQKKKKQNSVLTYRAKMAVCFLFFFFGPVWPWGWVHFGPCHKGQVQTCRLVAIGMFESGPYGRDPTCSTRGLGGNHKVWNISFLHDKIWTFQTLFFPTCSSQVRIGPLPLQAFLCFFFLVFFLAQFGPLLNMPIGTNRHVRPGANLAWSTKKKTRKEKKRKKNNLFLY